MSKYDRLHDHLVAQPGARWIATFDQIEQIVGAALPASAQRYNAWWANQSGDGHSQSAAWRRAGWRTTKLDLERRRVTFERDGVRDPRGTDAAMETWIARAGPYAGSDDRETILMTALREYVERHANAHLAALGGAAPDFEAPPRRRGDA